MTTSAALAVEEPAGHWPLGRSARPYLGSGYNNRSAASFGIDDFILSFLDRHSMVVNSIEPLLFPFSAALQFGKSNLIESIAPDFNAPGIVVFDASQVFGTNRLQSTPIGISTYYRKLPGTMFTIAPTLGGTTLVTGSEHTISDISPGETLLATLTTGYDVLLREIYASGIWSWRKLEVILGPSHTDLQRVAKGKMVSPQVGFKIDALHRFLRSLLSLTHGNKMAIVRAISTPDETEGLAASDYLVKGDYRRAFSAVMNVVSPRRNIAEVQTSPLRWYDQPSRAVHDTDREDHGIN